MRRLYDEMARIRDEAAFLSCRTAPEDEGERFLTCPEETNDGIGEPLPPMSRMRCRCMGTHGEHCVEEEHALPRPRDETAVIGRDDTEIILHLLVDVQQRRRWINADLHGK